MSDHKSRKIDPHSLMLSRSDFFKLAGAGAGLSLVPGFSGAQAAPKDEVDDLFLIPEGVRTRWTSSENPRGKKGAGAKENKGAKGHAFDEIKAGEKLTLMDVEGPGVVQRIRLTVNDRSPRMMRALRIDMYWDGADRPAVSAPLGDFFGIGLGRLTAFHNALFSNPEGRSFNCFVPMPFREGGRIVVTNESDQDLSHIFYTVSYQRFESPLPAALYFHAYWSRNSRTELGEDFAILPEVEGQGRFMGTNVGVSANPAYGDAWWGEGEVKIYLDGDDPFPTLVSTGTEDYIGTAWGMGEFVTPRQGCLVADPEEKEWCFYRYHLPDPVYFHQDIRVTAQQIGGGPIDRVRALVEKGAPMKLISVDGEERFWKLLEMDSVPDIHDPSFPEGWVNFYRRDDWSAAAYFYLDHPVNNLPALAPVPQRVQGVGRPTTTG